MNFEGQTIKVTVVGDCKSPVIELVGKDTNIKVNCINEACGEYEVQVLDPTDQKCFTFQVTCANCTKCPPQTIVKCLCDKNSDCPNPCDFCDTGVCNPKPCVGGCDNGTCLDDCIECVTTCSNGKVCQSYFRADGRECKKCVCPFPKVENAFGDCVNCINDSQCGPCKVCNGQGECVPKDCGTSVCNPSTNTCVECVNSGNCGPNQECKNNKCECIPGYCKNAQGVCEPCPCIEDKDCGKCSVCKNKVCVPKQCPDNQICDDGECKILCDCNNPTSCGSGKVCKNKGSYCVCESCGSCQNGCAEGCIDKCSKGEGCQPNPCTGSCENGTQCGPNCGCNPVTKKCEPCSEQSCGTNCGNLLGCGCAGITCEKDNTCQGTCKDAFDCGPNCTCYQGKCVSCSSFSCTDCSTKEKCKCQGTCQGDPAARCLDTLEIIKNEDCTITGKLTTTSNCSCPVITAKIKGSATDLSLYLQRYVFSLELFKGVTTEAKYRLDQTGTPGIADNERPLGGNLTILTTVNYKINNVLIVGNAQTSSMSISNQGIGDLGTKVTIDVDKFGVNLATEQEKLQGKTKFVDTISFEIFINEAVFPNTCEYSSVKVGSKITVSNLIPIEVTNLVVSDGTKLPLFTWFKSLNGNFTTKLKEVYATKVDDYYIDILEPLPNLDAESCYDYKLEPDCGCVDSTSKRIVFCSPSSLNASFSNCNSIVDISVLTPCDANKNKLYSIFTTINGQDVAIASHILLPYTTTYTSTSGPMSRVFMKMDCDTQNTCEWIKEAPAKPFTQVAADSKCSGEMPIFEIKNTLLDYVTWSKDTIKHFADSNGSVILHGESGKKYTFTAYFKGGCAPFSGETPIGEYCSDAYIVTAAENCAQNKYIFTGLKSDSNIKYSLDPSYSILKTKTQLENLEIVTQPTDLYWSVEGTGIQGKTSLPTKTVCCDNTFLVERIPGANQLEVKVTNVTSSNITVTATIGSTSQSLVNIAPGATSSYTFTPLTGAYSLSIVRAGSSCGAKTYTGTIGSCSLSMTSSNEGCGLTAKIAGTPNCECKSLDWEVKITNVEKLTDVLLVSYESQIKYKDADVIAGTVVAQVNTSYSVYSQNVAAKGFNSGVLEIPCILSNNVIVLKDANFVAYSDPINPIVKFYNVNFSGYTVESFKVNGIELPFIVNAYEYYTSEPYSSEYLMEITLKNTSTGQILTGDFGVDEETVDIGLGATKIIYFNGVGSVTNCPTVSSLTFYTENIELEDGCKYSSAPFEFTVSPSYTVTPNVKTQTLNKVTGSTRKIKYTWSEDGIGKFTEFKAVGVNSKYSGSVSSPLALDKVYRVSGECDCTTTNLVVQSCLTLPSFTDITYNGNDVNFKLTNTGCYTTPIVVSVDGDPASVIVNYNPSGNNFATLTLTNPIVGQVTLRGAYQNNLNCTFTQTISGNLYEAVPSLVTCGTGGCLAGTYIWKVKVKRNGVFVPNTQFTIVTSPVRTFVNDVDGFTKKLDTSTCAASTTSYDYTITIDGINKTGSFVNNCTPTCVINENNVTAVTNTSKICDDATSIQINITTPTPVQYRFNDTGSWTNLSGGFVNYTIPSPGSTPNVIINFREQSDNACIVNKTVQFIYDNCGGGITPVPPPDCNLSANNLVSAKLNINSNLTNLLNSGNGYLNTLVGTVNVNNGDTLSAIIQDFTGGSGSRTYTWSVYGGATAGAIASTASTSITLTSFTGNTFYIGCLVTDTTTNCARFFSVEIGKAAPTCPLGHTYHVEINGCCANDRWDGSQCCPTTLCNGQCCTLQGKVCYNNTVCVTPGQPCPGPDGCYKYNSLGNCVRDCLPTSVCCAPGDCRTYNQLVITNLGIDSVCYSNNTVYYGIGFMVSFYYPINCPGMNLFLNNISTSAEIVYNGNIVEPVSDMIKAYTNSNGGTIILSRPISGSPLATVVPGLPSSAQLVIKDVNSNIIVTKNLTITNC